MGFPHKGKLFLCDFLPFHRGKVQKRAGEKEKGKTGIIEDNTVMGLHNHGF